jgi:hypothetical protein
MNSVDKLSMLDPETFDRLVDGELSEDEERTLLARLDQIPDGWRRCALAFLEARCWERTAQCVVSRETNSAPIQSLAQLPSRTRFTRLGSPWMSLVALAAVFLVAFGVGTLLPRNGDSPSVDSLGQAPPAPSTPIAPSMLAHDTAQPAPQIEPANAEDLYLGNLKLVNDSGKEIAVPVYDWNQQVAEEIWRGSQPLSAEVVGQLKRHQVRSQRGYVPVRLQDGRQVVLPVQEVDIVPVGGMAY